MVAPVETADDQALAIAERERALFQDIERWSKSGRIAPVDRELLRRKIHSSDEDRAEFLSEARRLVRLSDRLRAKLAILKWKLFHHAPSAG
jgi:hypothetical protein